MSYVTNVMLQWGTEDWDDDYHEGSTLSRLNELIASINEGQMFRSLTEGGLDNQWGGHKFPEVELVAAAFNYWRRGDTMAAIAAYPWKDPGSVRLFICDQDDDAFAMYGLTEAREWASRG